MQRHAQICITSVPMPFFCVCVCVCVSGCSMYEAKNRGAEYKYAPLCICCCFYKLDPKIMHNDFYFLLIICIFPLSLLSAGHRLYPSSLCTKILLLLVYISPPPLFPPSPLPTPPNLQATGRSCTLNKNCHPGQLAAMKHLFCLTFPGT